MPPKTRLDPLVKWKEREVEKARAVLAAGLKAVADAKAKVAAAEAQLHNLSSPAHQTVSIDDLDLLDRAASRARADAQAAEKAVQAATAMLKKSQDAYTEAHRKLETFKRANERQQAAIIAELEKQERKTLDEVAQLLRDRDK